MALTFSTLRKPVNPQVVDPSTGQIREEWQLWFDALTKRLNAAVGELATDPAPADAEYIVGAASSALTAERVATNSTSNTWNLATPGQAAVERAALTGDVAASANSNTTAIQADVVLNTMLANMAQGTLKGRAAGAGTGDPADLSATQATAILDVFTSALKGLAPASGGGTANFLRADATWAATGAGLTLLASGTVAAAATLDLVLTAYTGYRALKFVLESFIPATDDVDLWMRVSTNGGSSYDATSGYSYSHILTVDGDNGAFGNIRSGNAAQWVIAGFGASAGQAISNVAAEAGASAEITLFDQTVGQWQKMRTQSVWFGATVTDSMQLSGGGHRETSQDTDAVRFLFETGNITSGKYAVYGLS